MQFITVTAQPVFMLIQLYSDPVNTIKCSFTASQTNLFSQLALFTLNQLPPPPPPTQECTSYKLSPHPPSNEANYGTSAYPLPPPCTSHYLDSLSQQGHYIVGGGIIINKSKWPGSVALSVIHKSSFFYALSSSSLSSTCSTNFNYLLISVC